MTLPFYDGTNAQFVFEQIAKVLIDTGGQQLRLRFGTSSAVFTASSLSAEKTVTHGMGSTPVAVFATGTYLVGTHTPNIIAVRNITSTTFDAQASTPSETSTGTRTFYWLAIG